MSTPRRFSMGTLLVMPLVLFGCSEGHVPTDATGEALSTPRHAPAVRGKKALATLHRTVEVAEGACATAVSVGPEGGTVGCEEAGLRLVFPPGAVEERVEITVEIPYGDLVGYEFFPEGLAFDAPVRVYQSLEGTSVEGSRARGLLRKLVGAYVEAVDAVVDPLEVYAIRPASSRPGASPRRGRGAGSVNEIFYEIEHFSGYITASN